MKKQILAILACLMILGTIPVVAGIEINTGNDPDSSPLRRIAGKKTLVIGFTTKPRIVLLGQVITFRALSLRYMVKGEHRMVNVNNFQRMTFRNEFRGIVTNHFVCAIFQGAPL